MLRRYLILPAALLVLSPAILHGTSYVMMKDTDLADQASVIVVGHVLQKTTGFSRTGKTRYTVQVDDLIKGAVTGERISVDVLGGKTNDGRELVVFGVPRLAVGQRVLLFLVSRPDGAYGILHLLLGSFREKPSGAGLLAVRDLSEGHDLGGSSPSANQTQARSFAGFTGWLRDRAQGKRRAPDYFVTVEPDARVQEFSYPGVAVSRIFDFDTGGTVEWLTHVDGQPGLAGDGRTEFGRALEAWNRAPNARINFTLGGTTMSTSGLTPDGVNGVLYGDPNSEVDGTFTCPGGGVLGVGGFSSSGVGTFKNQILGRIQEVNLVMNDGVECRLTGAGGSLRAEEVYAHEVGHGLGFGHSCGDFIACSLNIFDEALMRAFAHFDGRGAALNQDDRAAALRLYCALNPFANLIFTQFVNGFAGGFTNTTRIVLNNNGDTVDSGEIRFFNADGDPLSVPLSSDGIRPAGSASSVDYRIDPGGVFEVATDGSGGLLSGVIEVVSDQGEVSLIEGTEVFNLLGNFVSVTNSTPANVQQAFVSVNSSENAGVAIYNPDKSNSVTVTARLRDDDGVERASTDLMLDPGQRLAVFVDEAALFRTFFTSNPSFTGTVTFSTGDGSLFSLLGLLQRRSNGALIAVSSSQRAVP